MQRRKGICGMHSETQSKTHGSKNVGSVMLRTIKNKNGFLSELCVQLLVQF